MKRRRVLLGLSGLSLGLATPVAWRGWRQRLWAPTDGPAFEPWSQWPPPQDTDGLEQVLKAGALAPSAHNAQPWRFRLDDGVVDIFLDPERVAPRSDPWRREACISLGCALENMVIAARGAGLQPAVTVASGQLAVDGHEQSPVRIARLRFAATDVDRSPLHAAIGSRRTHRGAYLPDQPIDLEDMVELAGMLGDERLAMLAMLSSASDKAAFEEVTLQASQALVDDQALAAEQHLWLRHSWGQIQRRRDGIPLNATGLSRPGVIMGQLLPPPTVRAQARAWLDITRTVQLPTARMYGLLAVRDPRDRAAAVRIGRIWQRLHLWGTARGIAMQPLNQAITMADREAIDGQPRRTAEALADLAGGDMWRPVLAFRMGYPEQPAPPSPRRALPAVVMDS